MPDAALIPDNLSRSRRWILLSACVGAFMATLDTSIVTIALPVMAREFHGSLEHISWVMTIYILINVSFLLTSGRLGDLLAPGKLYLLGILVFTGASVLCGLSPGLSYLVGARALQGLGASLMLGLAPKLIALSYAEGERGLPLGLFSTAFATGITVGAPLGGVITACLGWPFIFFINIPICGLIFLLGSRALVKLPAQAPWDPRAFDLWGGVILAGCLGSLMLALGRLRQTGWGDGWTLGTLALAAVFFGMLLRLERGQAVPLLQRELWRSRAFALGSMAVVLTFAAVMGTFFLLPFFLDQVYGYTPGQAGLLLAVVSGANALVAPLGGYLADRLGNMRILRLGSGLIVLGLGSLLFTGPDNSTLALAGRLAVIGTGFGMFQAPNLNEVLRGVTPSFIGLAAGTNAVLKNLGTLLGITLMVTAYSWINLHPVSLGPAGGLGMASFHLAFAGAVAVGAVNFLVNLLPRESRSKNDA